MLSLNWRLGKASKMPDMGLQVRERSFRMIDWSSCPDVERTPDRMSGAWVFRGTRIPVAALFENLEENVSLKQFVEWFPGVSLLQARHVLEHVAKSTVLAA
jgi:uncharacterized protein (DUF433 family)